MSDVLGQVRLLATIALSDSDRLWHALVIQSDSSDL